MLEKETQSGVRKATGSYRTCSIPGKIAALVPEFAVEDLPSVELQPRLLRLQWRTCPWAEHSDDDDDDYDDIGVFWSRTDLSLLTQAPRLQFCPKEIFHRKLRNQGCIFIGMNRCCSFPFLSAPHSVFSILTDLKRFENIPGAPARRGFG